MEFLLAGSFIVIMLLIDRWRSVWWEAKEQREKAEYWYERAVENAERCEDYERALALPVFSEEELEKDLWARAAQGDEVAQEILACRCLRQAERISYAEITHPLQ